MLLDSDKLVPEYSSNIKYKKKKPKQHARYDCSFTKE